MNRLSYNVTREEIVKQSINIEPNPRVIHDKAYTFGDILNIWTQGGGSDKIFIRDDYYLTRQDIFISMDFKSYTHRTIKQTTSFKDDAVEFTEAFIPSIEDLLEHKWFEYVPMSND